MTPTRSSTVATIVRIYLTSGPGRREQLFAVRSATSALAGLQDYYRETLEPHGYHNPVYGTATLTVEDNCGTHRYRARCAGRS